MNSRLAWIAVVSIGISLACWRLVSLSSGTGWMGEGRSWAFARGCASHFWVRHSGEQQTIELPWSGSDDVEVDIPAKVYYQPGPKASVSVSGNSEVVGHVRLRGGTLKWDDTIACGSPDSLEVRFTGPPVTAWTLNGSGTLQLTDIKQDVLHVATRGSGTVTGNGEADQASVDVAGSATVDLSKLVARDAAARVRGSAEVDLAPREAADISIAGSAVVTVHGAGARITSHVAGSGQIRQLP